MPEPNPWFREGAIVCVCSDESAECVEFVRTWCKSQGYGKDDVKIVKRNGQILAEAKRALSERPRLCDGAQV